MAKEKKKKHDLLGSDDVIDANEVIAADKDTNRKEAFREAYKRVMQIVPRYFMQKKKKPSGSTSGGFSQSIVVTPEIVELQTNENKVQENVKEDRERAD